MILSLIYKRRRLKKLYSLSEGATFSQNRYSTADFKKLKASITILNSECRFSRRIWWNQRNATFQHLVSPSSPGFFLTVNDWRRIEKSVKWIGYELCRNARYQRYYRYGKIIIREVMNIFVSKYLVCYLRWRRIETRLNNHLKDELRRVNKIHFHFHVF